MMNGHRWTVEVTWILDMCVYYWVPSSWHWLTEGLTPSWAKRLLVSSQWSIRPLLSALAGTDTDIPKYINRQSVVFAGCICAHQHIQKRKYTMKSSSKQHIQYFIARGLFTLNLQWLTIAYFIYELMIWVWGGSTQKCDTSQSQASQSMWVISVRKTDAFSHNSRPG